MMKILACYPSSISCFKSVQISVNDPLFLRQVHPFNTLIALVE